MKKIIFINLIFLVLLILFIEILFRVFLSYNVQGISKNLIISKSNYSFNAPDLNSAKAFGVKIYTDRNGFRIKKNHSSKIDKNDILVIGGSVTFGPAINAEDTFVEKLNSINSLNVRNASVFGTTFENNIKTLKNFKFKDKVEKILISFPLDDILSENVKLSQLNRKDDNSKNFNNILKNNKIIGFVNAFIRSKSATYVFIKGIISNPQENNYTYDIKLYENEELLNQLDINLTKLNDLFDREKIIFFSIPYAAQVKNSNCLKKDISEDILKKLFKKNNFQIVFLHDEMCKKERPINFYLKNDPVHLNIKGHNFVFENLKKYLN